MVVVPMVLETLCMLLVLQPQVILDILKVVEVSEIYDNVGDVVRLTGVSSETYNQYNDLYRISEINVGAGKSFTAISDKTVVNVSTSGIGTSA